MATPTVTLNADGSITDYELLLFGSPSIIPDSSPNNVWAGGLFGDELTQMLWTAPEVVQNENYMAIRILEALQKPAPTSTTPDYFAPNYVLETIFAVRDGLVTAAQVTTWANEFDVQVGGIFPGAPSISAPTTTESFLEALNDPALTTSAGGPSLNQVTAPTSATPIVTLHTDGSLTAYAVSSLYFPPLSVVEFPASSTSGDNSVSSFENIIAQDVNQNILSATGAGTDLVFETAPDYYAAIAIKAVQDGLVTASQLATWATTTGSQIDVTGIPVGTPSQTVQTTSESFIKALNDPILTTQAGVATLNQLLAQQEIAQQQQSSAASQPGITPITGDSATADAVQAAYIAFYGRPADAAGLTYWESQLTQSGGNLNSLINAFGNSAESQALYGGLSITQQVVNIYQQEFNRAPDASGEAYWIGQITNGSVTASAAALAILNGATGNDKTIVNDKLVVANSYTEILINDSSASQLYAGNTAASNARAFLSAVSANTTQAAQLAGVASSVAHDIQAGITGDLAGVGATASQAVQLIGVTPTQYALHA